MVSEVRMPTPLALLSRGPVVLKLIFGFEFRNLNFP